MSISTFFFILSCIYCRPSSEFHRWFHGIVYTFWNMCSIHIRFSLCVLFFCWCQFVLLLTFILSVARCFDDDFVMVLYIYCSIYSGHLNVHHFSILLIFSYYWNLIAHKIRALSITFYIHIIRCVYVCLLGTVR